jgi:hypothetical protein
MLRTTIKLRHPTEPTRPLSLAHRTRGGGSAVPDRPPGFVGALYLKVLVTMIAAMKSIAAIRSNPPTIFLFKVPLR